MYFEDLTVYTYSTNRLRNNILNVGWLSIKQEFNKGKCSPKFIENLTKLNENPIALMRGSHYCEWCIDNKNGQWLDKDRKVNVAHGNGEIEVKGNDGLFYRSPRLVLHYITEHGYRPPAEFIEAVERL